MGRRKKKTAVSHGDLLSASKKKEGGKRNAPLRKKVDGGGVTRQPVQSVPYTVEDYMAKVEEYVDCFQVEMAIKFCERALQLEPNNLQVLDTMAPLLLETGEGDRALELLQRSVSLSPDKGHAKYLYIGQMMEGEEAIKYITKGIEIMTCNYGAGQVGGAFHVAGSDGACLGTSSDGAGQEGGASMTDEERDELSSAYCSLAEVYLTDVCFESDAGQRCYECCCKAVEVSPSNPEPYQLMASCLLSQQLPEKAKEAVMKGLAIWLPSCQGDGEQENEATQGHEDSKNKYFPAYLSRVGLSKLLLELEEYEVAFEVLKGLLQEDDEVVGVWYLMGWLHHLTKDADSARFYLEQMLVLYKKLSCDEEEIFDHASEILKELGPASLEEEGDMEEEEEEEEEEGEEEEEEELEEGGGEEQGEVEVCEQSGGEGSEDGNNEGMDIS